MTAIPSREWWGSRVPRQEHVDMTKVGIPHSGAGGIEVIT